MQPDAFATNLALVARIEAIAREKDATVAQIAGGRDFVPTTAGVDR